jgi:hypothetical protein
MSAPEASPPQLSTRIRELDVGDVRRRCLDAVSWWSARARRETSPPDRLWICFGCAHCGAIFDRTFRLEADLLSDESAPRLFRCSAELERTVRGAITARPRIVSEAEWRGAGECACGAPAHHRHVIGAAVLHSMLGTGADLVATRIGEETEWLRVTDGSGSPSVIEPTAVGVSRAFERPVSLFDGWDELLSSLPVEAGSVLATRPEPGVWLLAAATDADLSAAVDGALGAKRRALVRVATETARGWPEELAPLADAVETGAKIALVVELETLRAEARAWARSRLGADVIEESGRWSLATERGDWPVEAPQAALLMTRHGLRSTEACALLLDDAWRALDDRIETLRALTAVLPGASFEVQGSVATAKLADGRERRQLRLTDLPTGAAAMAPDDLVREAAFLFDVAPDWADHARVCPCGAPVSVELRLVSWPVLGDPADRPWALRLHGEADAPAAAEVVALCCDRHVRIPAEAELRAVGIEDDLLERRLDAEVALGRPRVRASVIHTRHARAVVVRGPFVSSVVLSDRRTSALWRALRAPFEGDTAVGFAVGSDALVLLEAGNPAEEAVLVEALRESGLFGVAFHIRRDVDLTAPPLGDFDVVSDRR